MKKAILALLMCFLLACPQLCFAAQEEAPVFSSMKQIAEYVFECAANLEEEIEFRYAPSLDAKISGYGDWYQMFYSSGMAEWDHYNDAGKRLFQVSNIRYSTANRILYVFNNGHMELFTRPKATGSWPSGFTTSCAGWSPMKRDRAAAT